MKQRILIIQLYSNGDCLYATTLAVQLKKENPGCWVQWAVFESHQAILCNNPYIDEIIPIARRNEEPAHRLYRRMISFAETRLKEALTDRYYFPQLIANNLWRYDGCLRRSQLRALQRPITVEKQAVLVCNEEEKQKAAAFANAHRLQSYKNVVLFETSPLSGQVALSDSDVQTMALAMVAQPGTCVVLSSYKAYGVNHPAVIDGNGLSIRETIAFSHYCTLLVGCSSGISWGTLTTGGKQLPMIQLLSPDAYYFNPPSIDFAYSGVNDAGLIELFRFSPQQVVEVIGVVLKEGFAAARLRFHQHQKNRYRMHRGIVHYFLKRGRFGLLLRFIRLNIGQNGYSGAMLLQLLKGFVFFPAQLIKDAIKK
jgi:hypothetical protein